MGRLRAILLALVISAATATALSACGGGDNADLLPGETASEINANLDLVEQLVDEGDCVGAQNAAASVGEQVEALTGVDKELKEALSEGAARLNEVIVECDEAPEEGEEETTPSLEPEDEQLEEDEKSQQKVEKEAEKEAEKEEKQEEKEEKGAPPVEPPGQEKEEETETPSEPSDGGTSSGGVSPGAPAEAPAGAE